MWRYAVTLFIIAVATGTQWLLYPYSGSAPFILYYPSIILAALYGDGVSAIILSCLLGQFLFVNKPGTFSIAWPEDVVRLALFLLSALMIRQLTRKLAKSLAAAEVEKKRAQGAENWLATTLSSIGDAVISTDRSGNVEYMNPIAESLTEWKLAEAKGKPLIEVFNIVNEASRKPVENPVLKVFEKGGIVGLANHTTLIGKNGREFSIEDSAAPIRFESDGRIEGVILVFRDITEKYGQQKRLTEAMVQVAENEKRMRTVLESALDAVIAMDSDGMVCQWNAQAEQIFGHKSTEVMGEKLSSLIIPERDREAYERGMRQYLETGTGPVLNKRIEIMALNSHNEEFPVELSITPIRTSGVLIFYSFIRDISDRKRSERTLLDAIKSRDDFLSIASHELKTPLTTLKLQAQLRLRKYSKNDTSAFAMDKIKRMVEGDVRQIDRLARLIDDMLDISRISSGKFTIHKEPMELCAVIKEMFDRFKNQFDMAKCDAHIELCEELQGNWDRIRIEQVFLNLLTNAIKYGDGKPIHITLTREGKWAQIRVRDEGIGIGKTDLARIFGRFERAISASEVSGLGLGLFIVKQIVEMHEGKIEVESQIGKGSTFTVRLPLLNEIVLQNV
jgi:PAS domain S-box-containing protein